MKDRLKRTLKKNRTSFIIILVLWVIISIVLVAPIAYAIGKSQVNGVFNPNTFIQELFPAITSFTSIGKIFSEGYLSIYGSVLLYFTIKFPQS